MGELPPAVTVDGDGAEYRRRIFAWTLYDWANSAFATTILAAVLPVYYSQVAGSTLGSPARATVFWTITLSASLVIVAVLSPILGTLSDILRAKKRFLAVSVAIGAGGTALLALVGSGDWFLASVFFVIGRIGFAAGNVFYDALLPHVARPGDRDRVSTRGYAVGYVGGGLLLAVNIVMILVLGSNLGTRLSFLSVAVWWAVFSIPILRRVPEPPAAVGAGRRSGVSAYRATFGRLRSTLHNIRRYRQLSRFLVAYLIYTDGIGTVIGVAAIYGAELGFGAIELIAAILLVQFAGIPFSVIFGRIPGGAGRSPGFLAFVVWNVVALPVVGLGGRFLLEGDVSGTSRPELATEGAFNGEGDYPVTRGSFEPVGAFSVRAEDDLPSAARDAYAFTEDPDAVYSFSFNGRKVALTYSDGPNRSDWAVFVDGEAVPDGGDDLLVEAFNDAQRFEVTVTIDAGSIGHHVLEVRNTTLADPDSAGTVMALGAVEVLPAPRESSMVLVLGLLVLVQGIGIAFAAVVGRRWFARAGSVMTTKRAVILALSIYVVIAVWGFVLDAVIEFWYLAWLVAVVQGGSQALSRSLYADMSPASESGEFFGFFSVMSKFSAIAGPLVFAAAVGLFGSSRPAVLMVAVFFIVGVVLLRRVDVDEGRRIARAEDMEAERAHLIEGD